MIDGPTAVSVMLMMITVAVIVTLVTATAVIVTAAVVAVVIVVTMLSMPMVVPMSLAALRIMLVPMSARLAMPVLAMPVLAMMLAVLVLLVAVLAMPMLAMPVLAVAMIMAAAVWRVLIVTEVVDRRRAIGRCRLPRWRRSMAVAVRVRAAMAKAALSIAAFKHAPQDDVHCNAQQRDPEHDCAVDDLRLYESQDGLVQQHASHHPDHHDRTQCAENLWWFERRCERVEEEGVGFWACR